MASSGKSRSLYLKIFLQVLMYILYIYYYCDFCQAPVQVHSRSSHDPFQVIQNQIYSNSNSDNQYHWADVIFIVSHSLHHQTFLKPFGASPRYRLTFLEKFFLNKTKYFRLRLFDKVYTERPEKEMNFVSSRTLNNTLEHFSSWSQPEVILKSSCLKLKSSWSHPEVILKSS